MIAGTKVADEEVLDEIRQRFNSIEDVKIRENFRPEFERKESDFLVETFRKEPNQVLEKLIKSDQLSAVSFEAVTSEFLETDPDGAYKWLNENWNKFDIQSQERSARAAASLAVKEGDLTVAVQWAEFIRDEQARAILLDQVRTLKDLSGE